jgi:hypothetical protein
MASSLNGGQRGGMGCRSTRHSSAVLPIGGDYERDQTYTTALLKPLEEFGFEPEPYTAVPEFWPDFVME